MRKGSAWVLSASKRRGHRQRDQDQHRARQKQAPDSVEITMKLNTKCSYAIRRDSVTSLETAGVLGETFPISTVSGAQPSSARRRPLPRRCILTSIRWCVPAEHAGKIRCLLKRADRILAFAESGKGSLGKLIYDPTLYNRFSSTVAEFQQIVHEVGNGGFQPRTPHQPQRCL